MTSQSFSKPPLIYLYPWVNQKTESAFNGKLKAAEPAVSEPWLSIYQFVIPVQDKVTKHRCPVFVLGQKIKREIKIGYNAMPFDCIGFLIGFSLEPVLVVSAPHPLFRPCCRSIGTLQHVDRRPECTRIYQCVPECLIAPELFQLFQLADRNLSCVTWFQLVLNTNVRVNYRIHKRSLQPI